MKLHLTINFLEIDRIMKLARDEFRSFKERLTYYEGPNQSKTYRLLHC